MLYITNIENLISTNIDKLSIKDNDIIALIEGSEKTITVSKEELINIMSHVHAKDIRLISKDNPAALITLGTLLSKTAQAVIIGNPFNLNKNTQDAYIKEAFKGYKVSVFGERKQSKRAKPASSVPKQSDTSIPKPSLKTKSEPDKKPEPKPTPAIAEPKKIPKNKQSKTPILSALGISGEAFDEKAEKDFVEVVKNSENFASYRKKIFERFGEDTGLVMLKTGSKTIEELKTICGA